MYQIELYFSNTYFNFYNSLTKLQFTLRQIKLKVEQIEILDKNNR